MREAVFILLVIFTLLALTAFRYRRGIIGAWRVWQSFKEMKGSAPIAEQRIETTQKQSKLVRCLRCGTWVPEGRAIRIRTGLAYCSNECVESKVAKA